MIPETRCWYPLDIEKPVFRKDWVRPPAPSLTNVWTGFCRDIYDPEWIAYVEEEIGFPLDVNLIFHVAPEIRQATAHIDVSSISKEVDDSLTRPYRPVNFAMNWIDGGSDSEMVWYEPVGPYETIDLGFTEANTPFTSWPTKQLMIKDRAPLRGFNLVRTDVPHSIITRTEDRWSYSLRTRYGKSIPWHKVVEKLTARLLLL